MNTNPYSSSVTLPHVRGESETVAGLKRAGLEKQVSMRPEKKEGTQAVV